MARDQGASRWRSRRDGRPVTTTAAAAATATATTYLLHDTRLALGEGDVATRLVLDELDLNLAALTARLVIIVVVVVGGGSSAGALALDTAVLGGAIVVEVLMLILSGGGIVVAQFGGHGCLEGDGDSVGYSAQVITCSSSSAGEGVARTFGSEQQPALESGNKANTPT